MTVYEATVVRDGKWWMVHIPKVDGLTQARRLSEAAEMAREYIAASQDLPRDTIDVRLTFAPIGMVGDLTDRVAVIREERARAAALDASASRNARELARDLAAAHIPVRDIGAILDISHQRAHQLLTSR